MALGHAGQEVVGRAEFGMVAARQLRKHRPSVADDNGQMTDLHYAWSRLHYGRGWCG
jgi:hypothetical protein